MSGRGKARKSIELVNAAAAILEEIQPATVRAVCYRLFVSGHIENMSKGSTQRVSRELVWARENDEIPWRWIVDETREPERAGTWERPEEIIQAAVGTYRRDNWQDQPAWLEVWSEKGTVRGTLAGVLKEYGITFRVMHGYGSATALQNVALETGNRGRRLDVLYAGDFDPSGLHMTHVDLPSRLGRYGAEFSITRIALTADDCTDQLPSFDAHTKSKDPRYLWFARNFGTRCWELDAMSPRDLRHRVEQAIRARLDVEAWDQAIEIERAEVESMQGLFKAWSSILRPDQKYPDGAGR